MRRGTQVLAFCAVFVIGVLIGRVTAPSELRAALSSSSSTASSSAPISRDADAEDTPSGSAAPAAGARVFGGTLQLPDVGAAPVVSAERVVELEGEVRRLRTLVDEQKAVETDANGVVVPFPDGRTAKGDEQALHEALNKALAAHGLAGDVTALDCSEFPCIAHGRLKGDIDNEALQPVFDDAKRALGGETYASLSRYRDEKDPTKTYSSFSLSLFPSDLPEAEQQNLNKRLRARKNAYVDATVGD